MTSKLTREELLNIIETDHVQCGEASALARMALAAMGSEPVGKPFMYGIADPDGNAYIDEFCVSEDLGLAEDTVNELNYDREEGDELNYSVVALYRHAQPVPVVPSFEEWLSAINRKPLGWVKDAMREAYDACHAAMLSVAPQPQIAPQNIPENIPDGLIAAVNRLLDNDGSRGCYSAIECSDARKEVERLLAAAPQLPGSEPAIVPGKWIPVSEHMPERGDYLVTDGSDFDVQLFNGEQFIPGFVWEDKITHWMPLPAAPQEVKGE